MSSEDLRSPFHVKCRFPNEYKYRDGDGKWHGVVRTDVIPGKISWDVELDIYDPISFTARHVLTAPWADPDLGSDGFEPQWNSVDGKVNRKSHEKEYAISSKNEPLNIRGRTGLKGRGVLGRWGPNHAADPVVTRWKRDSNGEIVKNEDSGKPILQFVSIQRRDTKEWAIPGGMVDPGEVVSETVKREFMEEAMDSTSVKEDQELDQMKQLVQDFFQDGKELYKGYVDDPRNTDNSWMETVALQFHDESGDKIGKFNLKAGDDAQALKWTDVDSKMPLYASHSDFIKRAAESLDAHWE